jgi:transcriptional regulator with XRE-family HTH domain
MKVPTLRYYRERRGLTQRELAEVAGVARRSIANWELGESIRPRLARRVAEALGVEVANLCEEPTLETIDLSLPREAERTEQLLMFLRRYEEMAEQGEDLDWSADELTRVRGSLPTEVVHAAAWAADRGDYDTVSEILRRTETVLGWFEGQHVLALEQMRRKAEMQAESQDALETFLRYWPAIPNMPSEISSAGLEHSSTGSRDSMSGRRNG